MFPPARAVALQSPHYHCRYAIAFACAKMAEIYHFQKVTTKQLESLFTLPPRLH
jgi:hypothetical protein